MLFRLTVLCLLLSVLSIKPLQAQVYAFGGKAGVNYSKVSNLSTIILSEPYFLNYSIKEAGRVGWHLGIFYEYKLEDDRLGFQSEIMYAKQGGDVAFDNFEKDFHYKMGFGYQYLNIVGLAKWFPWEGNVSLGAGPFFGINVATRNITYRSWGAGKLDAFGTDLQQEQQLKNVLRGKNNFGLALDMGWDINDIVKVGGRWYWSGTNTVETQSNSYNFIPAKNVNTVFEFSVAVNFETLF
ncbi:MAG: outer membrane beta-barrel protein [Chitinophagaceae bacterium]